MADRISPEIPRHVERWDALRSVEYWNEQLEILYSFAINRPAYLNEYLNVNYMMDGKSHIVFEVSNEASGWISVFDTPVPGPSYAGNWYEGIPIQIEAHAKPGWRFIEWIGDIQSEEPVITTGFMGDAVLHARFEPYELPSVMISEIHYNPSADLQGEDEDFEFLELYNGEKEQVDLSGYQFTDGITFTFPAGSYIDPGEYIILASNALNYMDSGARCFQITSGRLNNAGEVITFCDPENEIVDQVHFDDHYPWPREPDGEGPSLELISPTLDNAQASSWRASELTGGSPGSGQYTDIEESELGSDDERHLSIFPNPFSSAAYISYSLVNESLVSVRVININGQEVDHLLNAKQPPGVYQLTWAPEYLTAGIYFIQFVREGNMQYRTVVYLGKDQP
ncbi:MAG: lamin tail domain-containing protein, partial [Bacteroidales bacterium]